MRGCFVTGTDTGVGKTTVSVGLVRAARRRGLPVAVMKPVESGCRLVDGAWLGEDAERLTAAAELSPAERDAVCPFRLEAPIAPSVAAQRMGVEVDMARIVAARDRLLAAVAPEFFLVEGAGGFLVPVGPHVLIADVAHALRLPVLVVAAHRLGAINHTLLTLEAIARRNLPVAGVVLNGGDAEDAEGSGWHNAAEIARCAGVRVWGRVPQLSAPADTERVADAVEAALDVDELLAALSTPQP